VSDERRLYRIHWVAQETGIPEATLRAWERRYQVPTPARTPSGYRVYSTTDVETVKRMRELCDRGMSAAEAAAVIANTNVEPERKEPSLMEMTVRDVPPSTALDTLGGALAYMEEVVVSRLSTVTDRALRCVSCAHARLEGTSRQGAPVAVAIALQHVDPERVVVRALLHEDRAESERATIASAEFTLGRVTREPGA
jgi:DNA-binding transcriptional MerR regulator